MALVGKNPLANAGDTRDVGSAPGQGEPLKEGTATRSNILAWRIPGMAETGGLPSMGSRRVQHD